MKGARYLVLALLLVQLAFALDTRTMEQMDLSVVQEGYIRAVGGELRYLIMNLSVPPQTSYQLVATDRPVTQLPDGNAIVTIESNKPTNPFRYKVTSSVSIKARKTIYLPQSYQLNYSLMQLTRATARIQSDDAEIRELARAITANSSDDFERISKLALWVNQHLTYDSSLAGSLKDAKWILKNRRGVCAEYSTLFIAFARSLGIPARFVSGMAYDDERGGWIGHAWAEVYIGEWVPVDPTWKPPEIGYLDASHLEILKYFDDETFDNVYALTGQNARLEWLKPDGGNGVTVGIVKFKEGKKESAYQLQAAATTLGFGMKTAVFATISSDDYRVVSLNLSPCTGNVVYVDDSERYVVLKPGESKVVSWVVTSNPKLSSSYWYQCPLILNSEYLEPKQVTLDVRPDVSSVNFNAFVEKSEVRLGENQSLYVDVGVGRKYEGMLYAASDEYLASQPITRSGRYSFSLKPKATGVETLYVASSLGGVKTLQFTVSGGGVGVDVEAPQFTPLGNITVYVKLASNETDRNIRVTVSAGSSRETKQLVLSGNTSVEFSLNLTDMRIQNITVVVESSDFVREIVKPITLYKVPEIGIINLLFSAEGELVRTSFTLSGAGDAKDVWVRVDGRPASISASWSVSVPLTPGAHLVEVEFTDLAGNGYKENYTLQVPAVSLSNQTEWIPYREIAEVLPALAYLTLLVTLSVAVFVLRNAEKVQ